MAGLGISKLEKLNFTRNPVRISWQVTRKPSSNMLKEQKNDPRRGQARTFLCLYQVYFSVAVNANDVNACDHSHDAYHARACHNNSAPSANNRLLVPGCSGDNKMRVPDDKPQAVARDSTQVADWRNSQANRR